MATYDDLIEALNRNTEAIESSARDRRATFERKVERAEAALGPARENLEGARRVYRLAKNGNLIGTGLIPLGLLLTAGSILTGGVVAPVVGLSAAAGGAFLKLFLCGKERVAQLKNRMEEAQVQYDEINDFLNNI